MLVNTISLKYPINPFTGTAFSLSLSVYFCFFPIIKRPLLYRRALTFTYFCSARSHFLLLLLLLFIFFNPHDDNAFSESIARNAVTRPVGYVLQFNYYTTTTHVIHFENRIVWHGVFNLLKIEKKIHSLCRHGVDRQSASALLLKPYPVQCTCTRFYVPNQILACRARIDSTVPGSIFSLKIF